ncbi:MAG TPA: chloride channel protein [Chloroflexota bacterium]|nr:chloride channel protein [Chloroflexota bacterium]
MRSVPAQLWANVTRALDGQEADDATARLGDFTVTWRVVPLSLIAIVLGIVSTVVAWVLVSLIGFVTNLTFYQRLGTSLVSPAGNKLGVFEIVVPVVGALIVGIMARYGSEKIRGHGIPEAIEAVLISGSRVEPKVALLKPLSAAIAIGTGGPFGAEGPIIMTGGAIGSLAAQFMQMTSAERKTLLAAGAAAGMAAIFASPVSGVLLAFEVLLFEFKPRSLIPVALASATAGLMRPYLLGPGPVFPAPPAPAYLGVDGYLSCILVGLIGGLLSAGLTMSIYAAEDLYRKMPIHWMWWPALGAVVVGIGGLIVPQTLGVGYDVIGDLIKGNVVAQLVLGIFIVKWIIWAIALSTGTSGGVLAPIFMIGAALGGIEALFLPHEGAGFWALLSMGATLGGVYRAPFTGIVFTLETTHDLNALLPLLITVFVSYGVMSLILRRSILTEKIARRGYHVSQEFAVDPLELIFVREAMRTNVTALPAQAELADLAQSLSNDIDRGRHGQRLYPVVDDKLGLVGVVTRADLQELLQEQPSSGSRRLVDVLKQTPVVAYQDEPLRLTIDRMAETGLTRFPVVDRAEPTKLLGMVALTDMLKARLHAIEEESHRERVLRLHILLPLRGQRVKETEIATTDGKP